MLANSVHTLAVYLINTFCHRILMLKLGRHTLVALERLPF